MQAAFQDSVHDSQQCFRFILKAMSEPGTKVTLPSIDVELPITNATLSILLTLVDQSTSLWLDDDVRQRALLDYLDFHVGAVVTRNTQDASFAVVTDIDAIPDLTLFSVGTEEQPHDNCTLIIETRFEGKLSRLTGPGIEHDVELALGLPESVLAQRQALTVLAPCGIDMILVDGNDVVALPRTTLIEVY